MKDSQENDSFAPAPTTDQSRNGLSSVVLAKRSGYSHRQTLYALDGRRTCPERVAEVLRAMIGPDGWRYLCGESGLGDAHPDI